MRGTPSSGWATPSSAPRAPSAGAPWSTSASPTRVRAVTDEPSFTFWDFKTFGWDRDDGIRIDHLLLSPQAADRLNNVVVHREVRGQEKPSDHVPVEADFAF